jgi:manganese/iron transport system permease protein
LILPDTAAAFLACFSGTFLSFHFDAATGPMIVVVQAFLVALALLLRHHGLRI